MKSPFSLRLLVSLLTDVSRNQPEAKGLNRDIVTVQARFEHEGVGFLSVALPSLCDAVDYGLSTGQFTCPTGFRKTRSGALPKLFSGLLCDVFDERTGQLKAQPCIGAIKCLREVLRVFKKFVPSDVREEDLDRQARRTFWETDAAIPGSFDPRRADLLSHVVGPFLSSLGSYEPSRLVPRHGPGAVFEGVVANQKWSTTYDGLCEEAVDIARFGFDCFASTERVCNSVDISCGVQSVPVQQERSAVANVRHERTTSWASFGDSAKLVSVPKNSVARRTITIEPLMKMFIQQGLNTVLRDAISRCPVLSNSLSLTDQSKNQQLALVGSRTGEWSTLDLSSASDLLGLKLVELVFARHARFLSDMIDCRSNQVEDKHSLRQVSKFAGMGNALTFPVQSVVFAALAIAAICEAEGHFKPSFGYLKRLSKRVRVYGDDIIVRTNEAPQVIEWIESFGLKVNRKKSFTVGNFRESCGLDAFQGYDVTPVYVRDDPQSSRDVKGIGSLVAAANQFWLRGCYSAATELQNTVEGLLGKRLPIVGCNSGALGWVTRVDSCEYQKWDPHLQQLVYRAPVIVNETFGDNIEGYPALLKFFLTPLIQRGKNHLKRSARRFRTRIVWRWKPTLVGSLNPAMG